MQQRGSEIRFGLIGTGYMGKRHAVALQSVGAVFNTALRPVCELLCSTTAEGAAAKAREFGFRRSTGDWRDVVADPAIDAIIIASIQSTHRDIALAAFEAGKPVLCEKPLGASLDDALAMAAAASASSLPNMVAFNYVRTPATQLAFEIIRDGEIGKIVHVRAEHNEDFLANPQAPASWRTSDPGSGTLGDLSPHIINTVQRLIGPIEQVLADADIVYRTRPDGAGGHLAVGNDDQANLLVRFAGGVMGTISVSRIGTGRKMGYAYEIVGTKGALRFDQEDQNSLLFYDGNARPGREGFTRLLMGPLHPDYEAFCLGPAHGTGYGDQIVIEIRDFLSAIETGEALFPTFADGLEVSRVVAAAFRSNTEKRWVALSEF